MSIVENVRVICKEGGVSIPKLEKELNLGNGAIYKWDSNSPSIDKIQKVANYFNVSVDKVLYGFELSRFEEMVRIIMNKRTCEQFAKDTGIDIETVEDIAMGLTTDKPEIEIVRKIANSTPPGYEVLVSKADLYQAAGYLPESFDQKYDSTKLAEEVANYETIAAHHDGEKWTEEEMEEIEEFMRYVRSKRKNQE